MSTEPAPNTPPAAPAPGTPPAPAPAPAPTPAATDPPAAAAADPNPWWGKTELGLDQDTANFYAGRNTPDIATALKTGMHAFKTAQERNPLPRPDPANLSAWEGWKDIGWTEKFEDYKVESPKTKAPQGYSYDEQLESTFLQAAHKARVPAAQAQALLAETMEAEFTRYSAMVDEFRREDEKQVAALRREWGAEADAKTALAQRAAKAFAPEGIDLQRLNDALGSPGLLRMFEKIGAMLGEEKLVLDPNGGGMGKRSETTIRAELNTLQQADVAVLMEPRHPRFRELNDRRDRLLAELANVTAPRG